MPRFNICRCFYTDNYFINSVRIHVKFENEEQFRRDYGEVPSRYSVTMDAILDELQKERLRRQMVVEDVAERRALIQRRYIRLHQNIFDLQENFLDPNFLSLYESIQKGNKKAIMEYKVDDHLGLYQFPVFSKEFCGKLIEEIDNFQKTDLPILRPNTMNYHGVILDEIGFTNFFDVLRSKYLSALATVVFPEFTADGLDSHRAFTVSYKVTDKRSKTDQQSDLSEHYDNAEVTLNVALNSDYEGGEIYFKGIKKDRNTVPNEFEKQAVLEHKRGWGILHRARQFHGALPIENGSRHNLIIWMRSSSIRNRLCPMCWKQPNLVPVAENGGYGDGFSSV